jgi:hypothetical protein
VIETFQTIQGLTFRFTRRRYGRQTYTWVEVHQGGAWLSLGDPWPVIRPAQDELLREAARVLSLHPLKGGA